MVCIYCSGKTQVVNSRPQKRLGQVWRRRKCSACQAVFTTLEGVDLATGLLVRTRSGDLAPFSRDKLFLSIAKALGHRHDAVEAASALTATVIAKVRAAALQGAVEYQDIIQMAHAVLQRFDKPAGVQYEAYHKLV